MSNPMESNVLSVDYDKMKQVFGYRFWNDHEDIYCVPTNRLDSEEAKLADEIPEFSGWRKAQYLVSEPIPKEEPKRTEEEKICDVLSSALKMGDSLKFAENMGDDDLVDAVVEMVWGKLPVDSKEVAVLDELIGRFLKTKNSNK